MYSNYDNKGTPDRRGSHPEGNPRAMTDYLTGVNKELLLDTLTSRIRAMNTAPEGHTAASVLEDLREEIRRGEYDESDEPVAAVAAEQDPLDAAADRIIATPKLLDAVRELPVGDVRSVVEILSRRADEHEKQSAIVRERRAQVEEAVQGLLVANGEADPDDERAQDDPQPNVHIARPTRLERLYNETGLRDRNGGR